MLGEAVDGVNQVSAETQERVVANEQQVEKVSAIRQCVRQIEVHRRERPRSDGSPGMGIVGHCLSLWPATSLVTSAR